MFWSELQHSGVELDISHCFERGYYQVQEPRRNIKQGATLRMNSPDLKTTGQNFAQKAKSLGQGLIPCQAQAP